MKTIRRISIGIGLAFSILIPQLDGQSLGNAGTLEGAVADPAGAALAGASVTVTNPITGYSQTVSSGPDGSFRMLNIPPNSYSLDVTAPGFAPFHRDVSIKSAVPLRIQAALAIAASKTTVTVEATGANVLENDPSAHVDVDRSLLLKLPSFDPGAGLSDAITYSTGGVAADANGFFHPLGDHAQVSFVIDGEPISDQQSKLFSTQLPTNAIQSMEAITGTPAAEFGDKSSLVAQITTRSGLGAGRFFGNVDTTYGTLGTAGGSVALGYGTARFGNFLALDGLRTGRFLDSPELAAIHDTGNNQSIFDRLDFAPGGKDVFHLNVFTARSWFQIPNDYDQLAQDQHQRVLTWNAAPGYQHTFSAHTLLSINPYVRKDQINYYPSRDPFDDTPATQSQNRQLLDAGLRADVAITAGHHNIKYGVDLKQTRLLENFGFGITDPTFNAPCLDAAGAAVDNSQFTDPAQCIAAGYQPNTSANPLATAPFSPGLLPYDLTRGGVLFAYHAAANIDQYAFYLQDSISLGNLVLSPGFRFDVYRGLISRTGPEPRLGISYNVKKTGTVLRSAYARTFETPFNENLLLSSATGVGGLASNVFGSTAVPIAPGFRNQFNTGLQQSLGRFLVADVDYFWKYTHNAYDFSTLLNTTITFPIAWHNSKLDGVTGRLSTTNLHGFQAYWTFGHTRARYFPPETGGLVPQGAPLANGVFRIDHDQAFQSTMNFRYQRPKDREWIALTYRFDSGLVVSGIPDAGTAMSLLTPNQEVSIGLECNGVAATTADPIRNCVTPDDAMGLVTSPLITLPQGGYGAFASQENDDHNPDRVKPRNVFNLAVGSGNLLHAEGPRKLTASIEVDNLTNVVALYNFLSTFSGTHFLAPRTVAAHIGLTF